MIRWPKLRWRKCWPRIHSEVFMFQRLFKRRERTPKGVVIYTQPT